MAQRGTIGRIAAGSVGAALLAALSAVGPAWLIWAAALAAAVTAAIALKEWNAHPPMPDTPPAGEEEEGTNDGTMKLIRKLASAIDAADPSTRGRAYRVSHFAVRVGHRLGMATAQLRDLEYAALLHDIGRTAIHYDVLMKRGSLSESEQASVRTHPTVGYEILKDVPGLEHVAAIVHAHHEQPNGKGYPLGLTGDDIPMGSRIIMAVAAFDALTSDRPYRPGLAPEIAYEELRQHRGTMFFTDVVDALIELHTSGGIFLEFDEDELQLYATGVCSSKAVEGHIAASEMRSTWAEEDSTGGPAVDVPMELDLDKALTGASSASGASGASDRKAS